MKKHLFAVTLISALFASSVLAADNTPTAPDFGKLRESAAAPFRLLGNLIGGNKAEAATAQPDQSVQSDESAIAVVARGMKAEFRQNGQWISTMQQCQPKENCGKWATRVELKNKSLKQVVDLDLKPNHDLLTAGFGVLAPAQAGASPGVLLAPGEYMVIVTFLRNGQERHKFRLGALTVTQDLITARRVPFDDGSEIILK